jgi:hypothetical protein
MAGEINEVTSGIVWTGEEELLTSGEMWVDWTGEEKILTG